MIQKKEKHLPYEIMMEELFYSDIGNNVLEQVLGPEHWETASQVPLRYRLIGLGFLKKEGLDELNENLMEHDCRPLYARNSLECTLIYAFSNRLEYKEWKKIFHACETVKEQWSNGSITVQKRFFQNNQITFGELEDYVRNYSDISENKLKTQSITWVLNEKIQESSSDYSSFFRFYASVMGDFTDVHEKAKYYFCKYFYYHLLEKIDYYSLQVANRMPTQEELIGLLPIKAESALRRRVTKIENLKEILRKCPLSPGALFEVFNSYFFGYVSMDWVELLLEGVTDIDELSNVQIRKLAVYIRNLMSKKHQKEWRDVDDLVIVKNKIEELQQMEGTKNSRKGETTIRKYLRGELDMDRTTLICFLLYFSSSVVSRKDIKISVDRLNEILDECGFSMLRKKNAFDKFVIKYIGSRDPVEILMLEIDKYTADGKNFYLYEMYTNSISNAQDIKRMKERHLL